MDLRQATTAEERRKKLSQERKINLENIGRALGSEEKNIHCENLIGATTLPLGVAGPIKISSFAKVPDDKQNLKLKNKDYYLPLATTEGALVASVNRGCKAINLSGGAVTAVELIGTTRGPVFETRGIMESLKLKKWLGENQLFLKGIARKTSSHIELIKFGIRITGHLVYIRFYFDTQEAMGMNMATIATEAIVEAIEEKTKIKCLSITGNFCVDKKPSWLNFLSGRGRRVWAETTIPRNIIKEVLKTSPENIYDVWLSKCLVGSAMSGSMAFNSHFANIVSAFFAATGQDLAHVTEASLGMTVMKILPNNSLYVSVYLPDLMIGTVGGGTKLKTKQEALEIAGAESANELVSVLGGAVLAGDISLLASLAEGSLAKAHQKLGR